jgi:hypothetical protein
VGVTFIHKADTGSNKPGKVAVQLSAHAYWHIRPTNFRVNILKPKIDRLSVTLAVGEPAARKKIRNHLIDLAASAPALLTIWKKRKGWGSGKYDLSYAMTLGVDKHVLVQCAKPNSSVGLLRFEFNPDAIGPAGVKQFRTRLPEITAGLVSYDHLAHAGKVTRLDIAVDLVNIDIEDLLISTPKSGVTHSYFGLTGKAETKYLNVNKRGSDLYVYDRKALLHKLQAEGVGAGSEFDQAKYTRVEVRAIPDKPITQLVKLHNRLKRINLLDIEAAKPPEQPHHWKLFQDACRYRGLAGALAMLPDDVRGLYEDAVMAIEASLWRPDLLWSKWPETLAKSGLFPEANTKVGSD